MSLAYVRHAIAGQLVRRPDTVITPPAPPGTGELGVIGDTLTYQGGSTAARDALVAAGWPDTTGLRVDGLTNRGIAVAGSVHPNVGEVIATWRAGGFDPGTWVVALGSNNLGMSDATWATHAKAVLDLIASGTRASYRVYWVMLALRRSPAPTDTNSTQTVVDRFQAVIESLVGYNSKISLVPLDVESYIYNGRDQAPLWVDSDTSGRTMTTAGYAVRNQFLAEKVPGTTTTPPAVSTARFPGDLGPGSRKIIWGIDEFDKDPTSILPAEDAAPETLAGVPAGGMREYYSGSYAALNPSGGAAWAAINRQHAAGRIPWISVNVGNWAAQADGRNNAIWDAFIASAEDPNVRGPIWFSTGHEPETETISKGGSAGTEADWYLLQKAFRSRMNAYAAAHGGIGVYKWKNLAFASCLTAYAFFQGGNAGGIDRYIPTPNDRVHDFQGADYYAWTVGAPMWGANIDRTVKWCQKWRYTLALAEWGVHHDNPDAGGMMQDFYDRLRDPAVDCIAAFYYNSAVSATNRTPAAQRWMLNNVSNGNLLDTYVALMQDPNSVHFWDLTRPDGTPYKRPAGV